MKVRPKSVTVICWILIVTGAFAVIPLLTGRMSDPKIIELMNKNPLPISVQYGMMYLGMLISTGVGIAMLYGKNWARFLYVGWSMPRDYAQAAMWWNEAAGQGYADAQNALGWMYDDGLGFSKDDAEAVKWWQKAAAQGNQASQFGLGKMYFQGTSLPKNDVYAYAWLSLSAKQDNVEAKDLLSSLEKKISSDQKRQAENLMHDLLQH